MRCMVECTPINILQLFCWPMTLLSSLGYPMITYTHPEAGNLPIKTLVTKQRPTNILAHPLQHIGTFSKFGGTVNHF